MFVKPSSAFVGKPSVVASSSGSAKKARYARLLPSTRKSSASRAGPSSSCSSAPVSVLGIGSNAIVRRRMPDVEIRPFSHEHLDAAAALLGQDASGVVCVRAGRMVGYLLGLARDREAWGDNVWVDYAGQAFEEAEHARDAYAVRSE